MTDFMITMKCSDLDNHELDVGNGAETGRSFCQCLHNIIKPLSGEGGAMQIKVDDRWITAVYGGVPDEVFQSIEEIISHTMWDIRIVNNQPTEEKHETQNN